MFTVTLTTNINFTLQNQPILDLAECLTKLGFASVTSGPTAANQHKNLQKYFQNLLKLQDRAKRTRSGLWAEKWVNDLKAYSIL